MADCRNICLSGTDASGRVTVIVVDVGQEKEAIEKCMVPSPLSSPINWVLELSLSSEPNSPPVLARYVPQGDEASGLINVRDAYTFDVYPFEDGVKEAWCRATDSYRLSFDFHDFSQAAQNRRAAIAWRQKHGIPEAAVTLLSAPVELLGLLPWKPLLDYSVAYLSDEALLERFALGMLKLPATAFFRELAQYGRTAVMEVMWSRRENFGLDEQALDDALWHLSRTNPRIDVADWLIATGADVNAQSTWVPELPRRGPASPVLAAAISGRASFQYMESLLLAGADPSARDEAGVPVMAVAAEYGWDAMQQLHQAGAALDDDFVLHRAVLAGHQDVVDLLIHSGVDLSRHREALWEAICAGKTDSLRQLVAAGMPLDRVSPPDSRVRRDPWDDPLDEIMDGPPVAIAVIYGKTEMIEVLAQLGADVNALGPDGKVPLIYAAEWDRLDAIDVLMSYGAEVPSVLFESDLISEATKTHIARRVRAEEMRQVIESACALPATLAGSPLANPGRRSSLAW